MWIILLIMLLASPSWADSLGCFEPSGVVPLAPHFVLVGTSTAATSKSAYVIDPAGTLNSTIADGTFTQTNASNQPGKYRVPFTVPSSPTLGKWTASYKGTMSGSVYDGGDDYFEVRTTCPVSPTTAGRTVNTDASGNVTVVTNNDKTGYSMSGTLTTLDSLYLRVNTAQAGAAGSITLDASASATDSLYNSDYVCVMSSTGAGQCRLITGYTGSSRVATVTPNWTTNPSSSSVFAVIPAAYIAQVNGTVNSNDTSGTTTLLTRLPSTLTFHNGGVDANLTRILDTAVPTPTNAGYPLVDLHAITHTGATIPTVTTTTTTANLTTNNDKTGYSLSSTEEAKLGFVKEITVVAGGGNTTSRIYSDDLTESAGAYVSSPGGTMVVNCPLATNATNRSIALPIINFTPGSAGARYLDVAGALAVALTVGDVCNIIMAR